MITKQVITKNFGDKIYPPVLVYSGEYRGKFMKVFVQQKGSILYLTDCALNERDRARQGMVTLDDDIYGWDQTAKLLRNEFYRFFVKNGTMQTIDDSELQDLIRNFVRDGELAVEMDGNATY